MTDKARKALKEAEDMIDTIRKLGGRKGKITIYVEEGDVTGVSLDGVHKPMCDGAQVVRNDVSR